MNPALVAGFGRVRAYVRGYAHESCRAALGGVGQCRALTIPPPPPQPILDRPGLPRPSRLATADPRPSWAASTVEAGHSRSSTVLGCLDRFISCHPAIRNLPYSV